MNWLKRAAHSYISNKIDQYKDWQDPDRSEGDPMPGPEVIVDGVDPVLYEKLLTEATAAGAVFNGSEVTFKGCKFLWSYDGTQSFKYTRLEKPFYFTDKLIDTEIQSLIAKAKGAL